jgi:ribonuclease G
MAACVIHAAASPGEIRVAVLRGQRLLDYAIDRDALPGVGDLHRGRVTARVPAMAGAFVAIGGSDGFLPDSDGGTAPEGTMLAVRITRAPQGGKGPRLSARHETQPPPPGAPGLLQRGPGAILRLATLHPDSRVVVDDPLLLAALRPELGERITSAARAFDDALEAQIEALADPVAALPGGATMSVHTTPALTAIDVDLAGATSGRIGKTAAHEAANRAIIPALATQIRLRNLAGAILVDFAGLSQKRRAGLTQSLQDALARDPLQPRLLGFSHLGLAEILRPRIHPPLAALLEGPHSAGLAALRHAVREQAARPSHEPAIHAAPSVIDAILADPAALADYQRRTGRRPKLHSDRAMPMCAWELKA